MTEPDTRRPQADPTGADVAWTLLPIGAHEGHGPHLPLDTDTRLAAELARRAASAVPGARCLPAIPFGMSWAYRDQAGTVSVSTRVLTDVLVDILENLLEQGHRRLLVVNGHDGNTAAIETAAGVIEKRHGVVVAALLEYWMLVPELLPDLFAAEVRGHAGEAETSMLMSFAPECVHLDRATAPTAEPDLAGYGGYGVRVFDRIGRHYPGGFADARGATPEKGELAMDCVLKALVDFMGD